MASQTNRISLYTYSQGEKWVEGNEDGHNDTVRHVDATTPVSLAASGTFTASGGVSPAANHTVTNVASGETKGFRSVVRVASSTSHSQDYAFNHGSGDLSQSYTQSSDQWDVTLTVNWDTDPGNGNDVELEYRVYEE